MNWAKRVHCNLCGKQRPHLSKIKNQNYMMSKLLEENTWSCTSCKNINNYNRPVCVTCGNPKPQETEEEFKSAAAAGTQRAEISYDDLKKQNEEGGDSQELIQGYIHKGQEQQRKMEQVKVAQQESERDMVREDDRFKPQFRGGSMGGPRGRGGGRGFGGPAMGGFRGGRGGRGGMGGGMPRGGGMRGAGGMRGGPRGGGGRGFGGGSSI